MAAQLRARPAAVAGLFYPGDPVALRTLVESLLAGAARGTPSRPPSPRAPKAVIAPHAGYVYSGPIAASAFATLVPAAAAAGDAEATGAAGAGSAGTNPGAGANAGADAATATDLRRVVLLGPAHRVPLRGLGLPGVESFATPLGLVPLDLDGVAAVERLPQVAVRPDAHEEEHSLEVELPFLQVLLGRFMLLPLVVGQASGEEVAEVLDQVWGGDDTVVVISSDLSHYLPAAAAERMDRETAAQIVALAGPLTSRQACGAVPINGLLVAARRRGLLPRQLDLRHSGDTAGDRSRVVGYGAWAFDLHAA